MAGRHCSTQQPDKRCDIRDDVIRPWNIVSERQSPSVNPGNRQSQRLSANKVGELRLTGMEDRIHWKIGATKEVPKQRAIRLVAPRTFGGAYQVEVNIQWRRLEQVIIDVRNDCQPVSAFQSSKRLLYIGI